MNRKLTSKEEARSILDTIAAFKSAPPSTASLHSSMADLSGRGFWISVRRVAQVHHFTPSLSLRADTLHQVLFSQLLLLLKIL